MLVRALWLAVPLLAACEFQHGAIDPLGGGITHDDSGIAIDIDAPRAGAIVDAPPGATCVGGGLLRVCFAPGEEPMTPYAPAATTIDTDNDCDQVVSQTAGYPSLCIKQGSTVTLTGTIRSTGARPLVLVALTTMSIEGTLDVSDGGAGHDTGPCNHGSAGANAANNGASAGGSGGGGGGFGTGGGSGGAANAAGGAGGASVGLAQVRGGCHGANGGGDKGGNGGGAYGLGGGAVYLIAGQSITVDGTIEANGGGGHGGGAKAGGGGGGSGGLIAFDAPSLSVGGTVVANGGGGGEGGDGSNTGQNGAQPSQWDQRAPGGGNLGDGGDGGAGSVAAMGGNSGMTATNGGGGGGGGGGRVKRYPPMTVSGQISPPAN